MRKLLFLLISLSFAVQSFAQQSISLYRNTDSFYTGTFESGGEIFEGVDLWGYIDLDARGNVDIDNFFFRYQLSRPIYDNLALEAEIEDMPNADNYVVRFAATYKFDLPLFEGSYLMLKAYPYGVSDGSGQKYSVFPYIKILDDLWIDGFVDYHVNNNRLSAVDDRVFVVEPQVNYAVTDILCLVAEFRHRGYLFEDENNFAFGLRFLFK